MKEVAEEDMNWVFEKEEKFVCGVIWVEAIWRERRERGGRGVYMVVGVRKEEEGVGEIVFVLNK